MKQLLIKLGLSDKEAKVYLALLELAEDTIQNISSKAGVNRATTYVIIDKLMQYGLASQTKKGKKTLLVAEDPRELKNILKERRQEIDQYEQELDENINQLTAVYNKKQGKPTVRYFEGADGLEALDRYHKPSLEKKDDVIYGVMPLDMIENNFPSRRKKGLSDRVKKGIKSFMIYTHKKEILDAKTNKKELRKSIFLSRKDLPLDMSISILPWGVKFYNLSKSNPFGILVEDANIAKNMMVFYQLAWQGAEDKNKVVG